MELLCRSRYQVWDVVYLMFALKDAWGLLELGGARSRRVPTNNSGE